MSFLFATPFAPGLAPEADVRIVAAAAPLRGAADCLRCATGTDL